MGTNTETTFIPCILSGTQIQTHIPDRDYPLHSNQEDIVFLICSNTFQSDSIRWENTFCLDGLKQEAQKVYWLGEFADKQIRTVSQFCNRLVGDRGGVEPFYLPQESNPERIKGEKGKETKTDEDRVQKGGDSENSFSTFVIWMFSDKLKDDILLLMLIKWVITFKCIIGPLFTFTRYLLLVF